MSARTLTSRSHRSTTAVPSGSRLITDLAGEWQHLHHSPTAATQMTTWGHTALEDLQRPGDVLDAIDSSDDPDPLMLALLELHQTGDPLAGRVLLQAMLPALMNRAFR